MTVIQKIIEVFTESKKEHEANGVLFPTESKLFGDVIAHLQTQLPAEEQQIIDAMNEAKSICNDTPVLYFQDKGISTYIKNLKK